jgi:hypothetical protein
MWEWLKREWDKEWPIMKSTPYSFFVCLVGGLILGGGLIFGLDHIWIIHSKESEISRLKTDVDSYKYQRDDALKEKEKLTEENEKYKSQIIVLSADLNDTQLKAIKYREEQNNRVHIKDVTEFRKTVYEFFDAINPEILHRARLGEFVIPIRVNLWAATKLKILSSNPDFNDIAVCMEADVMADEAKKQGMVFDINQLNRTATKQLTKEPTPFGFVLIPVAELGKLGVSK